MAHTGTSTRSPLPERYRSSLDAMVSGHLEADENLQFIYRSPNEEEIRLVEVTPQVGFTGEAVSFGFSAVESAGIFFPSKIILLHPDEWAAFVNGELPLPEGWAQTLSQLEQLWPAP